MYLSSDKSVEELLAIVVGAPQFTADWRWEVSVGPFAVMKLRLEGAVLSAEGAELLARGLQP